MDDGPIITRLSRAAAIADVGHDSPNEVARCEGIVRAILAEMREPTTAMWDGAENVSMVAEMNLDRLPGQHPLVDDAFNFPTARIWLGVMFWRSMISTILGEPWDEPLRPFFDEARVAARAAEPPRTDDTF